MFGNVRDWTPLFQSFLDLLYPRSCLQCHADIGNGTSRAKTPSDDTSGHFCSSCWKNIQRIEGPACPLCAAPFPSPASLSHSPDHHCSECREDPPAFSSAITPFLYEGTLVKAIQSLKYNKRNTLARPLARLLMGDLEKCAVDRVMAIPLHPKRLRSREFNQ